MAKPTTNAGLICSILSVILAVGIIIGLIINSPLVIILLLLPTVIYEAYRTEGESTRWASWAMLLLIAAEIIMVLFGIKFDVAQYLGASSQYVAGYHVPLGDLKVIFPSLLVILSIVLFTRTAGVYTRWLAVLIFIGSFAIVYTLDAAIFQQLIRLGINQGLNQINW